jgi:DNA repair protein RecN (Recombination protein N)
VLVELRVTNLGVIEELSLLFEPHMTALTGETGAGKTMLIEAIDLLLGGRADSVLVRSGADEAMVEGRFATDAGDEMVLARVVPRDGRSRAYIDGRLATAGALADATRSMVDLHGQHAHQSLLAAHVQRGALDRYAGINLDGYVAALATLRQLEHVQREAGGDARARVRELDLLRYQLEELDRAAIAGPQEDSELDRLEDVLSDAVAHRDAGNHAHDALAAEGGALDGAEQAVALLAGRPPYGELRQRLKAAVVELHDIASELRLVSERIEDDPDRLDEIRRRRQLLAELRRKYGDTLAEVLAERDRIWSRIGELEAVEVQFQRVDADLAVAAAVVANEASAVAAARREAAPKLAKAVQARLRVLDLASARLEVVVNGGGPADEVEFLLGANPGEASLPLAKVASGGELARTMLALRLVLSEAPETLIFDEVDAGIGGEAAVAVGASLRELAGRHQVLVVTHLAQVAAAAHQHVAVSKSVAAGRTRSAAVRVVNDQRVDELARMLSGKAAAGSARAHAQELLDAVSGRDRPAHAAKRPRGRSSAKVGG